MPLLDNLKEPELIFHQAENRCPYRWSAGRAVGTFMAALRDHRKILGSVCDGCGSVHVPAVSYCELCAGSMSDWREVGPRGVVMSWAGAPTGFEHAPVEAPFRFVLVRLAGADTSILHVAPDDDRIRVGATVVPEFRKERTGAITDIRWFVPEESG